MQSRLAEKGSTSGDAADEEGIYRLSDTFPAGPALLHAKFYVIGFEHMVEVVRPQGEVEYMPCEVDIVERSVREGISHEFHCVINPGEIPLGYGFKFKELSEERHKYSIM